MLLVSCLASLLLTFVLWRAAALLPDGPVLRFGSSAFGFLSALLGVAWLRSIRPRRKATPHLSAERIPRASGATYVGTGYEWTLRDAENAVIEGAPNWDPDRASDLFLRDDLLGQHLLLLGTTGTGKTRMLELLIRQAIRRGEPVAIVDPKGDERLLEVARAAAHRSGRPFRYFSLPDPKESLRYNPIGRYTQVREVADRIAAALPGDGEAQSFRNYAWEVVDTTSRALEAAGEPVTFAALQRYAVDQPWTLVRKILESRFPKVPRANDPDRVADAYEGLVRRGKLEACRELDAMISLAHRPHEHYLKMVSALLPILVRLGGCEALAPGWSWTDAVEKREIVYFFLGSLLGAETANAVAKMTLLDFQSFVGLRYLERRRDPFSLFVDELGDVVTPEFVHILNKSRGAGVRVVGCAQTPADFEAALGSRARALQIAGSVNSVIQFRAQSVSDAEAFCDLAGRRLLRVPSEGETYEPALFGSGFRGIDDFRAAFAKQSHRVELPVVPSSAILELPTFHYFGRWGERLHRGCVPWIDDEIALAPALGARGGSLDPLP